MKILFIPYNCISFNASTLTQRPLGGTETAVINLSHELAELGHDVLVSTFESNPPLSSPLYFPFSAIEDVGDVDVMIAVRSWEPILMPIPAKLRLLWTGDSYDQPQNFGLGDRRIADKIDYLCCVSEWHKYTLSKSSGFPIEKTICLRNGINPSLFNKQIQKKPKSLIYSSTPYRGLVHLPTLYAEINRMHPDSILNICSGFDVYAGAGEYPKEVLDEYKRTLQILEKIPGTRIHGNVTQERLAEIFLETEVLAYPNTFEETSCISVLEAKAAGCIPVTSKKAALPETVGNSGICIEGEPGTPTYNENFIKGIDTLFRNLDVAETYRNNAKTEIVQSYWSTIAEELALFLTAKL